MGASGDSKLIHGYMVVWQGCDKECPHAAQYFLNENDEMDGHVGDMDTVARKTSGRLDGLLVDPKGVIKNSKSGEVPFCMLCCTQGHLWNF